MRLKACVKGQIEFELKTGKLEKLIVCKKAKKTKLKAIRFLYFFFVLSKEN